MKNIMIRTLLKIGKGFAYHRAEKLNAGRGAFIAIADTCAGELVPLSLAIRILD